MRDQRLPLFFVLLFGMMAFALALGFGDHGARKGIDSATTEQKINKTSPQYNLPQEAAKENTYQRP